LAGEGATVTKVLEVTKEVKPACIILGSHQFVQMSGIDFESTGLKKNDLGSILWITPVGASVPPITSRNIKKLFPNMAVRNMMKYNLKLRRNLKLTHLFISNNVYIG
jgi:hypothetical protein